MSDGNVLRFRSRTVAAYGKIVAELDRLAQLATSAGLVSLSDAIREAHAVAIDTIWVASDPESLSALADAVQVLAREASPDPDVVAFFLTSPLTSDGYDDIAAACRAFPDVPRTVVALSCAAAIRELGTLHPKRPH